MTRLTFTVDAELLRELGERLVGRPHMALAELIKNSYDADASRVEITFANDQIRVVDDGHGMTEEVFIDQWMRIGTTAKVRQAQSPGLGRPLTGSKGVGRLSVQLLAREMGLRSIALVDVDPKKLRRRAALRDEELGPEIGAEIVWPDALKERELTDVGVDFSSRTPQSRFAGDSRCGTSIELRGLVDDWDAEAFRMLAREIWALQPPFSVQTGSQDAFTVTLSSPDQTVPESFDEQMGKILDIAAAYVSGRLLAIGEEPPAGARTFTLPAGVSGSSTRDLSPTRQLLIRVKVAGRRPTRFVVDVTDCQIAELDFELRVFDLVNRQPEGIKVAVAREYLSRWGGVHIYDSGFRLPYYGPDEDWLRIEMDHAHRLSRSELVPADLQVREMMQDLPTNGRIFGTTRISTSVEQHLAERNERRPSDALAIQVTRDRLVDNLAFDQLRRCVRLGLDLYALERARAKVNRATQRRRSRRSDPATALGRASGVVDDLKSKISPAEYEALRDSIDDVIEDTGTLREEAMAYSALLGALATAGMTSLAYEHEISKQKAQIRGSARRLRRFAKKAPEDLAQNLAGEAADLDEWAVRAERIRALFRPLLDEESRTAVARFDGAKLLTDVASQMQVLARAAEVDHADIPHGLQLPQGGYAAWSAVFQNLLTNAFRATRASRPAKVRIDGGTSGRTSWIRVQDNGEGVDLTDAQRLFEPFERAADIDPHSEALGLGGSGLGLTIVRMILDEIGATVSFASPEPSWATSIRVEWKEPK